MSLAGPCDEVVARNCQPLRPPAVAALTWTMPGRRAERASVYTSRQPGSPPRQAPTSLTPQARRAYVSGRITAADSSLGEAPARIEAVARKRPETPTGRTGITGPRSYPKRLRHHVSTVCCAKALGRVRSALRRGSPASHGPLPCSGSGPGTADDGPPARTAAKEVSDVLPEQAARPHRARRRRQARRHAAGRGRRAHARSTLASPASCSSAATAGSPPSGTTSPASKSRACCCASPAPSLADYAAQPRRAPPLRPGPRPPDRRHRRPQDDPRERHPARALGRRAARGGGRRLERRHPAPHRPRRA